jgi:hypothetical protein
LQSSDRRAAMPPVRVASCQFGEAIQPFDFGPCAGLNRPLPPEKFPPS